MVVPSTKSYIHTYVPVVNISGICFCSRKLLGVGDAGILTQFCLVIGNIFMRLVERPWVGIALFNTED